MKTLEPKNSEDLDAGWDANDNLDASRDSDDLMASSVSVKQPTSAAPATTDDLDLGWDTGVPESPLSHPTHETAAPSKQKPSRKQRAPVKMAALAEPSAFAATPPPPKLTKKARRDLERQQRAYSLKKQAEIKRQRKEQRRATAAQNESQPRPAKVAAPAQNAESQANAKVKSRHKSKTRRSARPEPAPNQQTMHAAPRATSRSNLQVESRSTAGVSPSDDPVPTKEAKTNQRHMTWWTIGIVLVVLALLFILQKR